MTRKSSPTQPRIAPQVREQKAQLNVRVAARTLGLVREYATFIESGLDYTVNAALLLALEDDAAFQAWRTAREAAGDVPRATSPRHHADTAPSSDEE
jgi:hypothetical protein